MCDSCPFRNSPKPSETEHDKTGGYYEAFWYSPALFECFFTTIFTKGWRFIAFGQPWVLILATTDELFSIALGAESI